MNPRRYLIDNSVWQRVAKPRVRAALRARMSRPGFPDVLICPPIAAEVGFSARDAREHAEIREQLLAYRDCRTAPLADDVLAIQEAVIATGRHRAVGAIDAEIAAYALANDATLLHYDRDFETVADCVPGFRHEWLLPAGTID